MRSNLRFFTLSFSISNTAHFFNFTPLLRHVNNAKLHRRICFAGTISRSNDKETSKFHETWWWELSPFRSLEFQIQIFSIIVHMPCSVGNFTSFFSLLLFDSWDPPIHGNWDDPVLVVEF